MGLLLRSVYNQAFMCGSFVDSGVHFYQTASLRYQSNSFDVTGVNQPEVAAECLDGQCRTWL